MARTVSCPICKRAVPLDDPSMPFCSDRCRMIDLGNWASEKYVISTPAVIQEPAGNTPDNLDDLEEFESRSGLVQ